MTRMSLIRLYLCSMIRCTAHRFAHQFGARLSSLLVFYPVAGHVVAMIIVAVAVFHVAYTHRKASHMLMQ